MTEKISRLLDIVAHLRDPVKGCPWDVEQDFDSIAPHTIEEAFEVADAIKRKDMAALEEELGDLLLQVVSHARMAEEAGYFTFSGVIESICNKLVRRHPHVFAEAVVEDAAGQIKAWEEHKAKERLEKAVDANLEGDHSALDGIALALPALMRSLKLQRRAARVGFDWGEAGSILGKVRGKIDKIEAELETGDETHLRAEVGELLFSCANLARKLDAEPEQALGRSNADFERRFRHMESSLKAQGVSLDKTTPERMDALWEQEK